MKRIIIASIIALFVGAGAVYAATVTCTVLTVEDGVVTLDCGKKAKKIKQGVKVKVKTAVRRKAVEGC